MLLISTEQWPLKRWNQKEPSSDQFKQKSEKKKRGGREEKRKILMKSLMR